MQIQRLAACVGLTLLVIAPAWAGRGDIDPNYGEGGRLPVPTTATLALPGDRLVIADAASEAGFRVRMVDASGRNVTSFGDGGVVLFDTSAVARILMPEAIALAPNGDLILTALRRDSAAQVLLRLGNDGQPVLSFGDRGDGLVEPALTAARPTASVVDTDGNIVLAQGSWSPDGNCEPTARLQRLRPDGRPDTGYGGDGRVEIPNLDICNGAPLFGARADGGVIVGDGHATVAVDAAGNVDPTFGAEGRLVVTGLAGARVLLLPDDGLLIAGSSDGSASSNDTVFLQFDRHGQPALDYGAGTGSVIVDLGTALLDLPFARESVDQLALDPDGVHVVARLSISHAAGSLACRGIARLSLDGAPDADFGRNGLTCLNGDLNLIGMQSDGAPLVSSGYVVSSGYWSGWILRLLSDNRPSPGLLVVAPVIFGIGESDGTATVAIERLAGRDGAVSVNFTTVGRQADYYCDYGDTCVADIASAGSDYTATSGRLDWASGDDTRRTVTVSTLDDDLDENTESLAVDFAEPGGGVLLVAESPTILIFDNDATPSPPPPPPPPPPPAPSGGGGGSVSWATPLALLALLLKRRRRDPAPAAVGGSTVGIPSPRG